VEVWIFVSPLLASRVGEWIPLARRKYGSRTVFLKVGGIATLGAILMGKGRKSTKGAKMLNH